MLPDDGSLPELTWEGANHVDRLILIGTPNLGSTLALVDMQEGMQLAKGLPRFPAAVVGTMPAAYQLLPRTRYRVATENGEAVDVLDVKTWISRHWGLADPDQSKTLQKLLPEASVEERQHIARDHLFKCLAKARQFHASLDLIADPPPGTEIHLFAGDAQPTLKALRYENGGRRTIRIESPGDGTVTRASALAEEPTITGRPRRRIKFASKTFLESSHIDLTRDRAFVDNVLDQLLGPR